MASAWGYVTSPYLNWYGRGTQANHFTNILPPAPEPPVFSPLELSGCVLWLDANDTSTIDVNQDTSGANVNRVMKWYDKAQPSNQNYYTHIGDPSGSGLYLVHTINGLNTVYFEPFTAMDHQDGGVTFNFQDRTFFSVIKPYTDLSGDLSGAILIFNGFDDTGAMNTGFSFDISGTYRFSMCENGIQCGIQFDLSYNPVNHRMIVMFAQSSTDLSGNAATFDTVYQSLVSNALGTQYNTNQCQYVLNSQIVGSSQDIAEIIMYDRVLTVPEQIQVSDYLADKWNASGIGLQWAQGVATPYPFNPLQIIVPVPL